MLEREHIIGYPFSITDVVMKRFFCFTAAICGPLAAGAALSAQERTDSLFYELQQVEVIATRVSKDAPVAHSELSAAQIARNSFGYDIPSLLALTPSVVASTETGIGIGGTSIRLRGTDATRINVTMNGVPLNDPDSHSMYWYDTPDLASSVGNMQIQRGAGTSTNGTGAFGGAVSMTSASIPLTAGGDAALSYGSFNTHKEAVHVSSGLVGGHWLADLRLTHIGSDGYVDRGFTDMKSYMLQTAWYDGGTVLKWVSFGGKSKTYLTYNGVTLEDMEAYGRRYHTSGQYTDAAGPYVLLDGTHVNYYDDQTDNYLQVNNQLIFSHSFSPRHSLNITAFHTYGYGYYKQYKDDAWLVSYDNMPAPVAQADLIRQKKMRNNRYGLNATGVFRTSAYEFIAGGSISDYSCPHYGTLDWVDGIDKAVYEDFRWYDNDVDKLDANLFAKISWRPVSGLNLYADLQYRYVDYRVTGVNDNYDWSLGEMQPLDVDRQWGFFNPHLGARYDFARHHGVSLSFAVAHKEPTRSDFTDRYNFSSLTAEPKPETLYDAEMAYDFRSRSADFGVNFYYMYYKDQLVPTGIVNDSEDNLNINVDDSFRRGVEMTAALRPLSWFSLLGSCTLSQNRIRNYVETIGGKGFALGETTIAYSPAVIASVALDFHYKAVDAVLRTQYVSKQYMGGGNFEDLSLPAYCVTNLNLGYTIRSGHGADARDVRFGVQVGNLFNSKYFSYGYGGSWLEGEGIDTRKSWSYYFPQACTNVLANVTVSF